MNINPNVFDKALDTANTFGKIVANVTDPKKQNNQNNNQPKQEKTSTNTNQPHTQTVEVKVGNPDQKNEKPVIVHEKKETHVHKPFPDGRNLTKEECEVEKYRIQIAHENAKEEREFNLKLEELRRKEREEREDYERQETKRRREEREKSNKRGRIIGYTLLGIGMVGLGYSIYSDYRSYRTTGLPLSQSKASLKIDHTASRSSTKPIKVEGTVK